MMKTILGMSFLLLQSVVAAPVFTLIDMNNVVGNSNIQVAIGASGGWGFEITNDSTTDWIAASASDFCPSSDTSFLGCNSTFWQTNAGIDTFGPYTDFFGSNFVT